MSERWVKRIGDNVVLTKGHEDDGWYEVLRRIEELENEMSIQKAMYRNLERKYEIAKQWNKCTEEEVSHALS